MFPDCTIVNANKNYAHSICGFLAFKKWIIIVILKALFFKMCLSFMQGFLENAIKTKQKFKKKKKNSINLSCAYTFAFNISSLKFQNF